MLIDIFIVYFVCFVCIPSFVPGETKKSSLCFFFFFLKIKGPFRSFITLFLDILPFAECHYLPIANRLTAFSRARLASTIVLPIYPGMYKCPKDLIPVCILALSLSWKT